MEEEFKEINNLWRHYYTKICFESRNKDFTAAEALKLENKALNRYRDVYPYDHSRVPLTSLPGTDYINASLVSVEEVGRRYILTQGPLPNTLTHFWTMIWEQQSKAVIMLNRVMEKGTIKCHQYWPQNPGEVFSCPNSDLTVENLSVLPGEHFNLTKLKLSNQDETREVLHFQYDTWPDFGVPTSPDTFLTFLSAVRDSGSLSPDVGPAVIHCSAGIGRSGSFILVDSCLLKAEKDGPDQVNIKETLLKMRTYRMGLIQTEDQLKFSYLSILEGARQSGLISPTNLDLSSVTRSDVTSSSSDDESDGDDEPPPLPPPRSESLLRREELETVGAALPASAGVAAPGGGFARLWAAGQDEPEEEVEDEVPNGEVKDPFAVLPDQLQTLVNGDANEASDEDKGFGSQPLPPAPDQELEDSPSTRVLRSNATRAAAPDISSQAGGSEDDTNEAAKRLSSEGARDNSTACILKNDKIEERKRELELRRRKKEDEKASTEDKIKKMKEKLKEGEDWRVWKESMKERILPFCVGLAMFVAGGYYYFRE